MELLTNKTDSLANQYRPPVFADVIGQEDTVTILQNQIEAEATKHGYLFTGGAGTGKTTVARIFAREVNGFGKGEIIEIDAASNNGVDSVRELRENCKFRPLNGGKKIYVIDECHMLSTGAWNALLKTLEEPPAHCIFILCTTDPQKIPSTIISRVQRFQFKRIATQEIDNRLNSIILLEGVFVDPNASEYIARLANGGMRDAISILETCLGYVLDGGVLTLESVAKILNVASHQQYIDLCTYKIDGDNERMLMLIEEIHESGKDLKQFVKGFMEFILDVEKYQILGHMEHLSAPSLYEDEITELGRHDLFDKWFTTLIKLNESIKYDPNPKVMIEGVMLCL